MATFMTRSHRLGSVRATRPKPRGVGALLQSRRARSASLKELSNSSRAGQKEQEAAAVLQRLTLIYLETTSGTASWAS